MAWADLLQPAIGLARDGIPISWHLHDAFKRLNSHWDLYPSSANVFRKADGPF